MNGPRLGFGCASLGSRISGRDGLAALARAADAGIDWFDVAPSYGDGQAERLLGAFLRGRADRPAICTKVGIQPGRVSLPKRFLRPAVRRVLAAAPGLRAAVRTHRPAAAKQPITGALVTASIDASLARLGVERVEVLALHDATAEEAARDDVLAALAAARDAGKAARIGIASSVAVANVAIHAPLFEVAQFADNPLQPGIAAFAPSRPVTVVTHGVFGAPDLAARIARAPALAAAMRAAGFAGDAAAVARAFLPAYAFAANPDGVVLMSMFSPANLSANLGAHCRRHDAAEILRLSSMIAAS